MGPPARVNAGAFLAAYSVEVLETQRIHSVHPRQRHVPDLARVRRRLSRPAASGVGSTGSTRKSSNEGSWFSPN